MSKRVLIVEDEQNIAGWVRTYFERAGFEVSLAHDGLTGLSMARAERPDLMILDLMLPGMDGLDVCRTIRQEWDLPIIMLTARADEIDRLLGLELGADDYVVKPFSPRELVARAKAVLRRASPTPDLLAAPRMLTHSGITLDLERHTCSVDGQPVDLTPNEYEILATLMSHPGTALTRGQLLDQALGESVHVYERTIDVHVRNLRRKLEPDPAEPEYILTVFGVGYKFAED